MDKNDETRLRHVLDAVREAVAFSEGRSRSDLDKLTVGVPPEWWVRLS